MSREAMQKALDALERYEYAEARVILRAALSEPKKCKYGDPMCPCQDGDMCHYEGPNPMTPPASDPVQPVSPLTLAGWCLEAMTDVADWGGYASAYFQEKHRLQEDIDKWKKRAEQCYNAAPPDGYVMVPAEPTAAMISAMMTSQAVDCEGTFPMLMDHLDYSGENKSRTVLKAAYKAMLEAAKGGEG